jgi:DNA-directed RNA polymerase beta subunit
VTIDEIERNGKLTSRSQWTYVPAIGLPVMVGSILCHTTDGSRDYGECVYDSGGYFIINDGEKVLMYRERLATDETFDPQKPLRARNRKTPTLFTAVPPPSTESVATRCIECQGAHFLTE